MEPVFFPLLFLVAVALSIVSATRGDANCRRHLAAWAASNGYYLVNVQRRWMTLSFFWRSKSQRVYAFEVEDADGMRRTGLARVGGFYAGSWSDEVVVRWDG